ncbi:DUF7551 domain-containing protein [Halorubrum salsamenti]|uniref:DUF7551 domain-containing protein n=1 Tax=Halorubrum salsamenti TaxID=2583990 RepID=UPI0011A91E95|nr:hypothetical protein [Halorubrum salsamenti]
MIGTTLLEISDHIESLASETGEYSLVCARYGDRPVPAAGLRFESRPVARAAARATEQYRDALRRYDPRLPYYDVIVRQEFADDGSAVESAGDARGPDGPDEPSNDPHDVRRFSAAEASEWSLSDPVVEGVEGVGGTDGRDGRDDPGEPSGRDTDRGRDRVEFCHEAAAAVFEALSAGGHADAESAVMDAYFDLAERVSDPDDLCLCLLEAMAEALHRRLTPDEQAAVLAAAAAGLPPVSADDPVSGAFERLAGAGVVDGYARDPDSTAESATVLVTDCALTARDGRFPTLPLVLELYRRTEPDRRHDAVRIASVDEGWQVSLSVGSDGEPVGIASAAIRS